MAASDGNEWNERERAPDHDDIRDHQGAILEIGVTDRKVVVVLMVMVVGIMVGRKRYLLVCRLVVVVQGRESWMGESIRVVVVVLVVQLQGVAIDIQRGAYMARVWLRGIG